MEMKKPSNKEMHKIAKMLADVMMEKVREQGLIAEIMDDTFNLEALHSAINYYFGMQVLKDGRIYLHNSGKLNEQELSLVDSVYDLIMPAFEELEEEDESVS